MFFFYPADFTFVCPSELEDLADKYADFQSAGCEIYSVFTDRKAWYDVSERNKKINYVMLAAPTHALSRDFEVYIESDGLAELTETDRGCPTSVRECNGRLYTDDALPLSQYCKNIS